MDTGPRCPNRRRRHGGEFYSRSKPSLKFQEEEKVEVKEKQQIDPNVALKIAQNLQLLRQIVVKQRSNKNQRIDDDNDEDFITINDNRDVVNSDSRDICHDNVEEDEEEGSFQEQIEFRKRFESFRCKNNSKQLINSQSNFESNNNNCDKRLRSNWNHFIDQDHQRIEVPKDDDNEDDDIDKIRIYYDLPLLLNCLRFPNSIYDDNNSKIVPKQNQKQQQHIHRRFSHPDDNCSSMTSNCITAIDNNDNSHRIAVATSSANNEHRPNSVAFTRKVVEIRNNNVAKYEDDDSDHEDYLDLDQDVDIIFNDDEDDLYGEHLNIPNSTSSIHQLPRYRSNQTVPKLFQNEFPCQPISPPPPTTKHYKKLTTLIELVSDDYNPKSSKQQRSKFAKKSSSIATTTTTIPKITLPSSSSSPSLSSTSLSSPPSSSLTSSSLSSSPPLSSSTSTLNHRANHHHHQQQRSSSSTIVPSINGQHYHRDQDEVRQVTTDRPPSCHHHSTARNYDRQVIQRWIVEKRRARSEQLMTEQLRKQLEKQKIVENCRNLQKKIRQKSKKCSGAERAPPPLPQQQIQESKQKQTIRMEESKIPNQNFDDISNLSPNFDENGQKSYLENQQKQDVSSSADHEDHRSKLLENENQNLQNCHIPNLDPLSDEDLSSLIQDDEFEEQYKKLPIITTRCRQKPMDDDESNESLPPTPVVRAQQKSKVLRLLAGTETTTSHKVVPQDGATTTSGDFKLPETGNQEILNEILVQSHKDSVNFEDNQNKFLEFSSTSNKLGTDYSKFVTSKKSSKQELVPDCSALDNNVEEEKERPIELSFETNLSLSNVDGAAAVVVDDEGVRSNEIPNWNQLCHRVFQSKSFVEKNPTIDLIQFLSAKSSSLSPIIDYFTTQERFVRSRNNVDDSTTEISDSNSDYHHLPQSNEDSNDIDPQPPQTNVPQQISTAQQSSIPQLENIDQINVEQFIVEQSERIFNNLQRVLRNETNPNKLINLENLIQNLQISTKDSFHSSSYRQFLFDLCKEIVLNHFDFQTTVVDNSEGGYDHHHHHRKSKQPSTKFTLLLPLQMQKQPFPWDNFPKFSKQILWHISRILQTTTTTKTESSIATLDEILKRPNINMENNNNNNNNDNKKSKLKRFGLMAYCRMQRKLDFVDSVLYREMLQDEQRWSGYFEPEIEEIINTHSDVNIVG